MLQVNEFKSGVHIIGGVALGLGLLAMAMKDVLALRILSACANFVYVIYGLLLGSPPLVIGGAVAIAIHGFHIRKLIRSSGESPAVYSEEIERRESRTSPDGVSI